jgi:MFS family permease
MTRVRAEASARAAFAYRDFRLYQVARLLSTIAIQMLSVAVGWHVYELTRRPFDLGLVGLVQFLPAIGLSLLTGHTADRFDRRRVVIVCYCLLAVTAMLLYLSSRAGTVTWPIYATMFLFATARAFLAPAGQALLPDLVPPEHFASAVAWGSSVFEIGAIIGPALGGWIYTAGHGPGAVYLTGASAYILASVIAGSMKVRTGRMERKAASFETIVAGVVYVYRNKILLGSISLDLFAVLFGGAVALLPIYARDILHVGPWGLGLLRSAPALGAGSVAVLIAFRPLRSRTGAIMLGCVALYGIATVVFGASRIFWISLAALVVVGASDMVSVVIRATLVQIVTPPEMRGRVSAVNMVFVGASNELGELESGMTAAWLGTVPSVILGGVAACAVVAIYAVLFPGLRRVDRLDSRQPLGGERSVSVTRKGLIASSVGPPATDGADEATGAPPLPPPS